MNQPDITPGERLFARCAHAPNARGYCGPPGTDLVRVAVGGVGDVPNAARQFSGVWVYLDFVARQLGRANPLDLDLVEAYWFGSPLPSSFSREQFAHDLVERFTHQAGSYWKHLTPQLESHVMPTHGFHVFGVYPWSRLLHLDAPEPVSVLDSCRLTPAQVVEVQPDRVLVEAATLRNQQGHLSLGPTEQRSVAYTLPEGTFLDTPLRPGDWVALHWDFVCSALTSEQAAALSADTELQLQRVNQRAAT